MTRSIRMLTTASALALGLGIGVAATVCIAASNPDQTPDQPGLIVTEQPAPEPSPSTSSKPAETLPELPPCPTEDSTGCYWDASEQGNGTGHDVVSQPGEPEPEPTPASAPRPADTECAAGPVTAYDTGVLFCGTGAGVATDVDPYGNAWAYCEPALAD